MSEKSSRVKILTADESTTLAVDVAFGVSPSGVECQPSSYLETSLPPHTPTSFPKLGTGAQQP